MFGSQGSLLEFSAGEVFNANPHGVVSFNDFVAEEKKR